jgi:thiol-disulfide isomerase/thioredoxin
MSNIPESTINTKLSYVSGIRKSLITTITSPKFMIIIGLIAGFVALALFVYNKYVAPRVNPDFLPNKEFTNTEISSDDNGSLYYFRVDWCPISKKVDPLIKQIEEFYSKNPIENVDFKVFTINGETQEDRMAAFEKKYNITIDGYPSLYLVKNDKIIEYNAKPDLTTLKEFINTAL